MEIEWIRICYKSDKQTETELSEEIGRHNDGEICIRETERDGRSGVDLPDILGQWKLIYSDVVLSEWRVMESMQVVWSDEH